MIRTAALALWLLLPAAAQALDIAILSPRATLPVFGEVLFEAEVYPAEEIARVDLRVDGRSVATFTGPPFRALVDVGQENRGHRFEVVVEGPGGQVGHAAVETPPVPVNLEVSVELRQLYVTVTRDGRRVLDLDRDDFTVLDEGDRQRLVTFERGDVPFTAVLLVDASESMRGERLRTAVAGARAFASAMEPLDQAKVVLFSDRILHTTPFSSFAEVLTAGLSGVGGRGGTALNDHLYLALRLLEKRQGRRLVILLSDGVDIESILEMRQVLDTVRRSRSLVYWIRLGAPDPRIDRHSAWRDAGGHRRELEQLEQAVRLSGGRVVTLSSIDQTREAFAEILSEIREQYVLGYYPSGPTGTGGWRSVAVTVAGRGLSVRARKGYMDD
ncbi:MAG: VWA domain-containing protein [Thermoanaerobaculia bacterium]|nr:VWA domain-containing protein [Thermoanaerobaculia bacterium]